MAAKPLKTHRKQWCPGKNHYHPIVLKKYHRRSLTCMHIVHRLKHCHGPFHGMGWVKIAITWGGIGQSLLQLQLFQFSNSNGKGPPILWSLLANVDRSLHPPTNVQCSLLFPFPDGKCCIFTPRPQGSNWINCDTFKREVFSFKFKISAKTSFWKESWTETLLVYCETSSILTK